MPFEISKKYWGGGNYAHLIAKRARKTGQSRKKDSLNLRAQIFSQAKKYPYHSSAFVVLRVCLREEK